MSRTDRVASDLVLVGQLYDKLTAAGLRVWWDRRCLKGGQLWEDGFVDGMLASAMIVPVLSRKQLRGFESLTPHSAHRADVVFISASCRAEAHSAVPAKVNSLAGSLQISRTLLQSLRGLRVVDPGDPDLRQVSPSELCHIHDGNFFHKMIR